MLTPVVAPHERTQESLAAETAGLPVAPTDPDKVAVLLNRNARRVTDALAKKLGRLVGSDNLYYSRSLEEAEAFAREIVQRGYGTVVCGGGDGTFVQAINMVQRYIDEANQWRVQRYLRFGEKQTLLGEPRFAFLRLGTGNAIGRLVGATHPAKDLGRIVDYLPRRTQPIPLIREGDDRFFFAGIGYDSQLLNDYNWLKAHTHNKLLKPIMHSVAGYFVALFGRTIPSIMADNKTVECRVTTVGEAYYVDPARGDFSERLEPGSTLFEGPASYIGAGSTPYYGYGFRIFPFARMMPNMMQLRISNMGPFRTLANLRGLWGGTHRDSKRIFDFLGTHIRVELSRPLPFQHSGDASGERDKLDLVLDPSPLQLVDLSRARQLA
ncbi:MAG: diacylglycerol kinase family protein [Myxococcota bacterium]